MLFSTQLCSVSIMSNCSAGVYEEISKILVELIDLWYNLHPWKKNKWSNWFISKTKWHWYLPNQRMRLTTEGICIVVYFSFQRRSKSVQLAVNRWYSNRQHRCGVSRLGKTPLILKLISQVKERTLKLTDITLKLRAS